MPDAKNPPNDSGDQRIAKLLARAGVASRREVERMIADGRVALNGVVIDTPATLLASLDGVTVDGDPVEAPSAARLFLYHKPPGLLVTERDPGGRPTIYDRLPEDLPRVVPVGRLDLNTEGLLLLTTDGGLKRQLELPATGVERAYRARAYGNVTQAQLEELIEGVEIEGVRYGSIDANLERRTGANVWIEMILTEGKNREVRRVLEYLGLQVSRLIRTRYGPFVLGDLPAGRVGEVRPHDVDSFRKNPTRIDLPQPARSRETGLKPAEPRAAPSRRRATQGPSASPPGRQRRAPQSPADAGQARDRLARRKRRRERPRLRARPGKRPRQSAPAKHAPTRRRLACGEGRIEQPGARRAGSHVPRRSRACSRTPPSARRSRSAPRARPAGRGKPSGRPPRTRK